jgi:hypothetical protein
MNNHVYDSDFTDLTLNPHYVKDSYIDSIIKKQSIDVKDFAEDPVIDLIKNNKKVAIGKELKDETFADNVKILYLSVILDEPEMAKYISKKIGLLKKTTPPDYPIKYDYLMAGRGIYEHEWNHDYILMIIYYAQIYGGTEMKEFAKELSVKHMHVMGYDNAEIKKRQIEKILKEAEKL